jgi:hypothetical protein
MSEYPRVDCGFFHLTPQGWVRQDHQPFPTDRVETWSYEMECPAEDVREQVCLRRIWTNSRMTSQNRDAIRARFGDALLPTTERNVTLECQV